MTKSAHEILRYLFDIAVFSSQPKNCLPGCLPPPPTDGEIILIATGKAGAAMARAALDHYRDQYAFPTKRMRGLVTTRHGYGLNTEPLELIEAGHPIPDASSQRAAQKALEIAASAKPGDLVLVLISGGGSALWSAPRPPLTLAGKQRITRDLLKSGATISEINCVRKNLSLIKNGRLAGAVPRDCHLVSIAISDVPGDAPEAIASGPTVIDSSSSLDALKICQTYGLKLEDAVQAMLLTPDKPGVTHPHAEYRLAATPKLALQAVQAAAEDDGFEVILLGDALEGEARAVALEHAKLALEVQQRQDRPTLLLSGGELTVTIKGTGRGGPNQEYALALAITLNGRHNIFAIACDTDGADGGTGAIDDPAGAYISPETLGRANKLGISSIHHLENNDSSAYFNALDDLIITGPTYTNVNDFRAIMVNKSLSK